MMDTATLKDRVREGMTRGDMVELIGSDPSIDKRVRAGAMLGLQLLTRKQVREISDILPQILEKLEAGEFAEIVRIASDIGVPAPVLEILRVQLGMYSAKVHGNDQA